MTRHVLRCPGRWPRTDGHRVLALAVVLVGVAVLVGLALLCSGRLDGAAPPALDVLGHRVVHGAAGSSATGAAVAVTRAASSVVLYPLLAVAAVVLSARTGRARLGDGLLAVVLLAVGSGLRWVVSVAVGRLRPPPTDWLYPATGFAFPSGHTADITIAVGLLVLGCRRVPARSWRRGLGWALAVLAAVAVAWSRVFLGVHWPTDVLGGWAFGAVWVALLALIGDRVTGLPTQPGRAFLGAGPDQRGRG